jgi:hypothetical protein
MVHDQALGDCQELVNLRSFDCYAETAFLRGGQQEGAWKIVIAFCGASMIRSVTRSMSSNPPIFHATHPALSSAAWQACYGDVLVGLISWKITHE